MSNNLHAAVVNKIIMTDDLQSTYRSSDINLWSPLDTAATSLKADGSLMGVRHNLYSTTVVENNFISNLL
jgi:hypothetical protein